MEKTLEAIFDYACPYCYRAHPYLKELKEEYPDMQILFCPCEAHPRPDRYGIHSNLCIMGMFYCMDHDIDVWQYHDLIYKAIFVDKINVEDINTLSGYVKEIADEQDFMQALMEETYKRRLLQNNLYAWEQLDLPAVPSFRMDSRILYAVEDVGVSKEKLWDFLTYQ